METVGFWILESGIWKMQNWWDAAIGRPAGSAAHGGAAAGDAAVAARAFEEGLVADAAPLLGAQP